MRHSLSVASLISLAFSGVALADAAADAGPDADIGELDRIVVTSTRTEQPLSRVGDSITVLDQEEVRASQKTVVSDLLALTPGVSFSRNGGLGSTTGVRIRGAEADQTVVLIDGVKLNDPSSPGGGYNFANLVTDDITRIEVLRGPQSTLWGSQAIGGVVNIVTSEPTGPLSAVLNVEDGARDTHSVRARVQSGDEDFAWRLGGSYLTTDGISSFDERLGGVEEDGYRNAAFNGRAIYKFSETVSADVRGYWSKSRNDFDGFPPPFFSLGDTNEYGDNEEWVAYAGLNVDLLDGRFHNRVAFAYTDTARQNIDPDSVVPLTFDATSSNARWEYQGTFDIATGYQAVFGLESEKSEMTSVSPSEFDPAPTPLDRDVTINSAYAQIQASPIESLTLTAGVRRDDHDEFGGQTNGRAAVAWSVLPTTLLRASYGEGFKAPTLYQLYSEYGNLALAPEEATGWDVGVEQHLSAGRIVLSATYFERDTDNMIDFVSCPGGGSGCATRPMGYYENIQKTRTDGVELAASFRFIDALLIETNYTRTDARNDVVGSANFDHHLPRRPMDQLNGVVSYEWPHGFTTAAEVQYVGHSFDLISNSSISRLGAYTLAELRLNVAVSETLEVFGRIENLFDEKYQTTRRYGSVGRGAFVGVHKSF